MTAFILYVIKSAICFSLFYVGYKYMLSRETFFKMNRTVLLCGFLLCILLPFFQLRIDSGLIIHKPVEYVEQMFTEQTFIPNSPEVPLYIPEVVSANVQEVSESPVTFLHWVFYFWLMGCIINIGYILFSLKHLFSVLNRGKRFIFPEYTLIVCEQEIIAFNIGRFIVISETDYVNHRQEIVAHELAHLSLRHTWDILFIEIILMVHWYNPFVWLLRKELKNIHEYQADHTVLSKGIDAITYQLLLVEKAVGSSSYTFASSFNQSKIKKRISMMLRERSSNGTRWKMVFIVPFTATMLVAFARPTIENVEVEKEVILDSQDLIVEKLTEQPSPVLSEYMEIKPDTVEKKVETYFTVDGEVYSPGKYNQFAKGKKVYMFRKDIPEGKTVYVVRQGWKNHPKNAPMTPEMYLVEEDKAEKEGKESVVVAYMLNGDRISIEEYEKQKQKNRIFLTGEQFEQIRTRTFSFEENDNIPRDIVLFKCAPVYKEKNGEEIEAPPVFWGISKSQQ